MGGNVSKQNILNETLTNISLDVVSENSTSVATSSEQTNTLLISGNKAAYDKDGNLVKTSISGITQTNKSKISVDALMNSVSDNKLQAELETKLSNAIKQVYPGIQIGSQTDQDVRSIVRTNIDQSITVKNLQDIKVMAKQSNNMIISNTTGIDISDLTQSNESEQIVTLVTDMANKIAGDVASKTDIATTASQEQGLFPAFGSGGLLLVFVIIIIIAIGGGLWYMKSTGLGVMKIMTKPAPIAAMVLIVAGLIATTVFYSSSPKKEE